MRSRHHMGDVGRPARSISRQSAGWRSVSWAAGVVDHVRAGVFVSRAVGFNYVPAEQREYFVEARIAAQVGVIEIRETAIAETNIGGHQGQSRFAILPHAITVLVDEGRRVNV